MIGSARNRHTYRSPAKRQKRPDLCTSKNRGEIDEPTEQHADIRRINGRNAHEEHIVDVVVQNLALVEENGEDGEVGAIVDMERSCALGDIQHRDRRWN